MLLAIIPANPPAMMLRISFGNWWISSSNDVGNDGDLLVAVALLRVVVVCSPEEDTGACKAGVVEPEGPEIAYSWCCW